MLKITHLVIVSYKVRHTLHAIFGCDAVSAFHSIGKAT